MPVEILWENKQKTVVRQIFTPPWTLDQHRASYEKLMSEISQQPHTVHLIADLIHSQSNMSRLLISIPTLAQVGFADNLGTIVFANRNRFTVAVERLTEVYAPSIKQHVRFAATLEEAYAIIDEAVSVTS